MILSTWSNALLAAADADWSMHERQRVVALTGAVVVALVVCEMVRRRKLREEYSWIWIAAALTVCVLALSRDLLLGITRWIGAASSASTLFFGAIVFLMALCIQFSIRLSRLTHRQRTLAQRLALLEEEARELRRQARRDEASPKGPERKDEVA